MAEDKGKLAQPICLAMESGFYLYWTYTDKNGFELRAQSGFFENGRTVTRLCWKTYYFNEARKVNERLAVYGKADRRSLREVCHGVGGAMKSYYDHNQGRFGYFGDGFAAEGMDAKA